MFISRIRKSLLLSALLTVLLAFHAFPQRDAHTPSPIWSVGQLRCEYRINPLGIDQNDPRLSWTFRSNRRNEYQAVYQLLVADSRQALLKEKDLSWNSGRVESDESIGITYAGKPLRPFTRYYWMIQAWDRQGRSTGWSTTGEFETGFLHSAWQGTWIGNGITAPSRDEDYYGTHPAPLFRKEFRVGRPVRDARLYISGLGYYEASLNGNKIGDAVLDPGWTEYKKTVLYSVYDITAALRSGDNSIGILLGNGWYNPLPLNLFGAFNLRNVLATGQPKLIANIRIRYTDGDSLVIATDGSWTTADSYILKNNVYLGEEQDGRKRNLTTWLPARPAAAPEGTLTAQSAPPIRITRRFRPVALTEPEKQVYVFDLGQNFAGWINMKIKGRTGQEVHFRYGEELYPNGRVNGMTAVAGHIKEIWHMRGGPGAPATAYQQDSYTCRGDTGDIFQPHFTFHVFRYVEVTGLSERPAMTSLEGLRLNADLPVAGSFTCSNQLLNRVQQNTLYTFLSNVFSVQSDCPGREKQGYGADMVVSAEAFMYNFDMSCFYAKSVSDFADDVRPNGGMPECAPYNGISTEGFGQGTGPIGWQLAFPFLQEQLYRFYGNRKIIADNYTLTRNLVEFLRSQSKDLLIDHGIGDHVAINPKHVPLTSAAFFYHHVKLLAEFAGILGIQNDKIRYTALADSIKDAFNARYLQTATGQYDTAANQTTQVFPLWYDMVPREEKQKALTFLLEEIRDKYKGHLSTGIFGTKMLFDVLRRCDRNDIAWLINTQKDFPGYAYMLDNGATTLWETWQRPDQNSLNHPMFGSISEWFYRSLLGINPAEDAVGMDKVVLKPFTGGDLKFAKGDYVSIRGKIVSEWQKKGDRFYWKVSIPPNMRGEIHIPAGSVGDISESGIPVQQAQGLRFSAMENGFAILEAVSGSYYFSVRSQTVMPLYPDSIPNSRPAPDEERSEINKDGVLIISKISRPTLTLFRPPEGKANGTSVIICPGGGYWVEAAGHEGTDVAKKFNEMGVTAIVLKYRIPSDQTMIDREIGALQDAQQAIKTTREHAFAWHIDPSRIGIMGFSAGGHLASTAGTHFSRSYISNTENTSLRPDFMILVYPVITCGDSAHRGSCEQLIGKTPSPEKIKDYSNELQVTDLTPPAFMILAADDPAVPPQNSIGFFTALRQHHIPAELHIYQESGHGFGLHLKKTKEEWIDRCRNWMAVNGWLQR